MSTGSTNRQTPCDIRLSNRYFSSTCTDRAIVPIVGTYVSSNFVEVSIQTLGMKGNLLSMNSQYKINMSSVHCLTSIEQTLRMIEKHVKIYHLKRTAFYSLRWTPFASKRPFPRTFHKTLACNHGNYTPVVPTTLPQVIILVHLLTVYLRMDRALGQVP